MAIFGDIIKGALGPLTNFVGGLIHSGEEKAEANFKLLQLQNDLAIKLEEVMIVEMNAKKDVIVAEMQQGDLYTKRARPTLVYAGLGIVIINHMILPWIAHFAGTVIPTIDMPVEFWIAWGGVTGSWVIGRSAEKRGMQNKLISAITGNGTTK